MPTFYTKTTFNPIFLKEKSIANLGLVKKVGVRVGANALFVKKKRVGGKVRL